MEITVDGRLKSYKSFETFLGEQVQEALRKYENTQKPLDSNILLRALIAEKLCDLAKNDPRIKFVPRFSAALSDTGVFVKFDLEDLAKLDEHWKKLKDMKGK